MDQEENVRHLGKEIGVQSVTSWRVNIGDIEGEIRGSGGEPRGEGVSPGVDMQEGENVLGPRR